MSSPISPAIIINERYDSQVNIPSGYNALIMGYTSDGVSNEPIVISKISEFLRIFGEPDGSHMEQIYAYDAVDRVVRGGANAIFIKLPYGKDDGYDIGTEYTALLYPAYKDTKETNISLGKTCVSAIDSGLLSGLTYSVSGTDYGLSGISYIADGIDVGEFVLSSDYDKLFGTGGLNASYQSYFEANPLTANSDNKGIVFSEPTRVKLTESEYDKIKCGEINWDKDFGDVSNITEYDMFEFGKAGLIVLDSDRTKSPDTNSGYYVSVADNSTADPSDNFNAITKIYTSTSVLTADDVWSPVDSKKLNFNLVSPHDETTPCISRDIVTLASSGVPRPWEDFEFSNYLNITLWRLREDVRNGSKKLVTSIVETYTGSISKRETVVTEGGHKTNDFIENKIKQKSNGRLTVLVNDHISDKQFEDTDGRKTYSAKIQRQELIDDGVISTPPSNRKDGDGMYSMSIYTPIEEPIGFDIGNLPSKIKSALCTVDNPDRVELDLSLEAGLGTIWTTCKTDPDSWNEGTPAINSFTFDDTASIDVKGDLGRPRTADAEDGKLRTLWSEVNDIFLNFTEETRVSNGGYQHLHIADTLRQILVNGRDCKVYSTKARSRDGGVFSEMIYHPSKNLTKLINSSVMTIDGQWFKANTIYTPNAVWIPSSGVVAESFAKTDYPWVAAAGVSNGHISNVVDIALDPVQRDRDLLWKIHHNASFYDRSTSGFLRFADKTQLKNDNIQLRQNSARRLLVWLEKNLRNDLRSFLFEPNNLQTRIRFKNAIELRLKTLLDSGAIEDYAISLSKNTAISRQEGNLIADIAIKITGVVDRVILNFDILRLDQPFQEVI